MADAEESKSSSGHSSITNVLPLGLTEIQHTLTLPLVHDDPSDDRTIQVFVREVFNTADTSVKPYIVFLQGGPGFPSPRVPPANAWVKKALSDFRVLLLDQRGTGRSTPLTVKTIPRLGDPATQAEYISHFRAPDIVHDCEVMRKTICGEDSKLTLLGQSFGGFCALTYLSLYPSSLKAALLTCGLAPVGVSAEDVYKATYERMAERNRRYFKRYPGDVKKTKAIVKLLLAKPAALPSGGTLTARRFLSLGLGLGFGGGLESLHTLLESPFVGGAETGDELSFSFLNSVDQRGVSFETNPIYWFLHESIYCEPGVPPSEWAALRVLEMQKGSNFDIDAVFGDPDEERPIFFYGEMVYPWMSDDFARLGPLREAADILASKSDWGPLYDKEALKDTTVPVAALVAYDDVYVERRYSEQTAELLGDSCKIFVSNEYQHSWLYNDASSFSKLLGMTRGTTDIPS